jgi:hypothetical protein
MSQRTQSPGVRAFPTGTERRTADISVPAGEECSLNRREELAPPSCGAFLTERGHAILGWPSWCLTRPPFHQHDREASSEREEQHQLIGHAKKSPAEGGGYQHASS